MNNRFLLENAVYANAENTLIDVDIDNVSSVIPANECNMHYAEMVRQTITPSPFVP